MLNGIAGQQSRRHSALLSKPVTKMRAYPHVLLLSDNFVNGGRGFLDVCFATDDAHQVGLVFRIEKL